MKTYLTYRVKDEIECAVARGWSFDRIVAAGFTPAQVERVMAGMDEANRNGTRPAAAGAYGRNTE